MRKNTRARPPGPPGRRAVPLFAKPPPSCGVRSGSGLRRCPASCRAHAPPPVPSALSTWTATWAGPFESMCLGAPPVSILLGILPKPPAPSVTSAAVSSPHNVFYPPENPAAICHVFGPINTLCGAGCCSGHSGGRGQDPASLPGPTPLRGCPVRPVLSHRAKASPLRGESRPSGDAAPAVDRKEASSLKKTARIVLSRSKRRRSSDV